MSPERDYPTADELQRLREWPFEDAEWGWPDGVHAGHIHASTGGWSGNEDIIDAMQDNLGLWHQTWDSTRRGGHYVFLLPKPPVARAGS